MTRFATAAAAVLFLIAGCGGGSSGGGGPSDVDSTKQISAVTDAEKSSLCDWFADKTGGYGAASSCEQAVLTAPPNKDACMTDFPTCSVMIGTFETCVNAVIAAQNTCTDQALLSAEGSSACQTVGAAGCFN